MTTFQAVSIILVTALFTFITRAVPFAIFGKRQVPKAVVYLGNALPASVIVILIIYSVKDNLTLPLTNILPALIAISVVVLLHIWRRNNLLSIGGGTLCYMLLVQLVFK